MDTEGIILILPWQSSTFARTRMMANRSRLTLGCVFYRLFPLNQDSPFCVPSPTPAPV